MLNHLGNLTLQEFKLKIDIEQQKPGSNTLHGRPPALKRSLIGTVSRTLVGTIPSEYLHQVQSIFIVW